MKGFDEKMCPCCRHARLKRWTDLTDEEKFLAARLPMSATFTRKERETHLYCPHCWNEISDVKIINC